MRVELIVTECELYKEERDVLEGGMREVSEGGMKSFDALDSSEKNHGYARR